MSRSVRPDSLLQPEFRSSGEERRTSASANSVSCLPHYRFGRRPIFRPFFGHTIFSQF